VTVSTRGWLVCRARIGHANVAYLARLDQGVPQRCWAAWRVMPRRRAVKAEPALTPGRGGAALITAAEVSAWVGSLVARGLAPSTATRALATLRSILAFAVADARVQHNVAASMGDASPVMSGRHSAGDGKSCRRAPFAGTDCLPDRLVPPARPALIEDVARVSAR
jgi:hypothetical protein